MSKSRNSQRVSSTQHSSSFATPKGGLIKGTPEPVLRTAVEAMRRGMVRAWALYTWGNLLQYGLCMAACFRSVCEPTGSLLSTTGTPS